LSKRIRMHSLWQLLVLFALLIDASLSLEVDCEIVVAGGSTASLAAAWAAAESNPQATVCLTDPTDWLGGQLTASAVSAIDFGPDNPPSHQKGKNLPASFNELYGIFSGNPGKCWVSQKCFQPQILVDEAITPHNEKYSNLKIFYNTVITKTARDAKGNIIRLDAVQRTAAPGTTGWERLQSEVLSDWYSLAPSTLFPKKEQIVFGGIKVAIEATEFGDVLMTGDIQTAQGIEYPNENSTTFLDVCGQANTIDFYMHFKEEKPVNPWTPPLGCRQCPSGQPENGCCHFYYDQSNGKGWDRVWTYRRVFANGSLEVNPGDISLQNYGSQDSDRYLFLSLEEAKRQVQTGWQGGINISALAYSEQRSYGWYWFMYNNATDNIRSHLIMNRTQVATLTGLAKMPYLRDARRSLYGIEGFRLELAELQGSPTGPKFPDTIGIGNYPVDIHEGACPDALPHYLNNRHYAPYYIPFRALTVQEAPNLLVAGKNMAQSYHANACTRLHPEEWVTGSAAGIAAAMMVKNNLATTYQVYQDIATLQKLLLASGQPLEWSL